MSIGLDTLTTRAQSFRIARNDILTEEAWRGRGHSDALHGGVVEGAVRVPGPHTVGAGGVRTTVVHRDDRELGVGGQVDRFRSSRGGGEAHLDHPFGRGPHWNGPAGVLGGAYPPPYHVSHLEEEELVWGKVCVLVVHIEFEKICKSINFLFKSCNAMERWYMQE